MEFDTRRAIAHLLLTGFEEYFECTKIQSITNDETNFFQFSILYIHDDGKNRNPRVTGLIKFSRV